MRGLAVLTACSAVLLASSTAISAQIEGEYLEARTCLTYTGPCFANGEMGLAGKEALMAWQVDEGTWNDVVLDGLGAALVLNAESTLGNDGVFNKSPGRVESVILVDQRATERQRQALVAFVKDSAAELTKNVVKVQSVPFNLENNHINGKAEFSAGQVARIETRGIQKRDCVCSNEIVFYQPLAEVENFSPAYSKTLSFQGEGLDNTWTRHGLSSAFLATFRR